MGISIQNNGERITLRRHFDPFWFNFVLLDVVSSCYSMLLHVTPTCFDHEVNQATPSQTHENSCLCASRALSSQTGGDWQTKICPEIPRRCRCHRCVWPKHVCHQQLNLGMAGNRKLSKSIPKLFLNLFSNGVYQSIPSNLIAMCYHKGARQFLQIDVNRPYT